jgi:hypothetical protein
MNDTNSDEQNHPAAGDGTLRPPDGDRTPVGEKTSVKGDEPEIVHMDDCSSPPSMDIPLPPVEEIYFPEGGFRAWLVVFGVSRVYLDWWLPF